MSLHQSLLLSVAAAVVLAHVGILHVACEVRLVDSPATVPNAGRVEVRYPNTSEWLDVCANDWDFTDGQIVCKELGYPGTVLVKTGSEYGAGGSGNSTGGFICTGDETSLLNCTSHDPNKGPCGDNHTAGVVCAAPGYEGCKMEIGSSSDILIGSTTIIDNTVEKCIKHAKTHQDDAPTIYAAMEGNFCLVLGLQNPQSIANLPGVNDSMCDTPCRGNPDQRCGGNNLISVYNVQDGFCTNQTLPNGELAVQPTPEFFYFGTVVNFFCNPGFYLQGAPSVQCVMGGYEPAKVTWTNSSTPECTAGPQTTEMTTTRAEPGTAPPGVNGALVVAALVLSILNTIILFLLIIAICILRRREGSSHPALIPRAENSSDNHSGGEVNTSTASSPNPVPAVRRSLPPYATKIYNGGFEMDEGQGRAGPDKNHRGPMVPVSQADQPGNDMYVAMESSDDQYVIMAK